MPSRFKGGVLLDFPAWQEGVSNGPVWIDTLLLAKYGVIQVHKQALPGCVCFLSQPTTLKELRECRKFAESRCKENRA